MIAFVRGRVAAITLNAAVVDVGGVGYHVFCTPGTIAEPAPRHRGAAGHVDGRP